ncbi:unnamed protein product [Schistosoma turkestanicum]|nr:unnamed protein product [Schistosoma turkestanicum]
MSESPKKSQSAVHPDPEEVRVLESSLKTKHRHKSRQLSDLPESDEAKLNTNQSNAGESATMKPPVVKKRKKLNKKHVTARSSDTTAEMITSVPLVEITPSGDHQRNIVEAEPVKSQIIQKEHLSLPTLPPLSTVKYEQSKQFAKSKSPYPSLPERMQRLRRNTALSELSTSPDLSLSDLKAMDNLNHQISDYEFFIKEWSDHDDHLKQKDTTDDLHSTSDLQNLSMKLFKSNKHSRKRTESTTIDNNSFETNQENQPLLGFVERTKQDLLLVGRASSLSNQQRIKYESKFLYYPTDTEISLELKTGGKLPRYLEDEGYYIGKLPYVAPTNLRRLENRILKEIQMNVYEIKSISDFQSTDMQLLNGTLQNEEFENEKRLKFQSWFREDSLFDMLPNPLRNIPSRPTLWNDQFNPVPEKLQIFYVPPLSFEMTQHLFNMESRGLVTSKNLSTTAVSLSQRNKHDHSVECRLHVDIRRITFDFHPIFSLEHVHAQNLRQIIHAYELTLSRDQVNACIQRISALKRALKQLEAKRNNNVNSFSEDELLDMDYRIEDYYHEISLMRRARNHAEAYEKGLLTSALRAWKRVKESRQTSGCTNTTVRLKITKQITNVEQDQIDWDQELDDIVNEEKHEYDKKILKEQKLYEEELVKYKKEKKQLDAALRRQRLRESGQMGGELEDNAELERNDAQILAQKKLRNPPISPKPFNAQAIRDETEMNLRKFRRLPNEPKISVSLLEDVILSSNNECSRTELNRRLKLLEYSYFIKLYYNNKLVETSQLQLLNHNFTLDFHWILPIQIRHKPESIVAKLFEKHGWTSHQIAEFHIALPKYTDIESRSEADQLNMTSPSSELDLQHIRFTVTTGSSLKLIHPSKSSSQKPSNVSSLTTFPSSATLSFVGAQPKILLEDLDGSGEKIICLSTTGTLYATAKWISSNPSLMNTLDIEACNRYSTRSLYSRHSMKKHATDWQSLIYPTTLYLQSNPLFLNDPMKTDNRQDDYYNTSILDPNNTMDAKLLNLIQTATGTHLLPNTFQTTTSNPKVLCHTRASGVNYFHLNFLTECFDFCTDEDLDKSKRIRLIRLRQNRVPGFENIIIPTFVKYIPDEIFDSLNEKKDFDDEQSILFKGMKAFKEKRKIYIEKIKSEVNQHFQDALNKKSLREIVIEEEIPNILFLLPFFKRLFQPKRPLRPRYEERRRIGPQYVQDSGLELIVTIQGAYNLPNRSARRLDQSNYHNKTENINEPLKPFAVIRFQQNERSTIPSEGRNPCWNTEFRFPFFLSSEHSKLETMNDPIIINVYDQVTFSQTDSTQNEPASHIIQRIEHRLIGSIEIPLSTVYLNTKISGKINLSIPIILQGYETINPVKSSIRPMIDVLMTLEPLIFPPSALIDTFISIESTEIQTILSKWYHKLSKHKFMHERQFKPLVMNSDCQELLMNRFLTALNPPEEFLPGIKNNLSISESMLRLARYVSLIPYESDVASFPGLTQVWCTCDQFLSMLCGDEEEHAVLLACYFMYIMKYASSSGTVENHNEETTTTMNDANNKQTYDQSSINSIYLCIGEAIPEGRTVYVLTEDYISTKQTNNLVGWRVWNPVTGQHYSVHDVNSPLRSVWGLVNLENILANVQSKHEPWELVWDLKSKKHWLPVFEEKTLLNRDSTTSSYGSTSLPQTIQPEKLIYVNLEQHEVDYIKFELETVLRDALMDWRKTKITKLNYEYMKDFNKMLENLEKNNGAYYDGLNQLLDRISSKYYIYGFPMNFSYMEPDEIIARVKSKGIHELIGNQQFTPTDLLEQQRSQFIQQRSSIMSFSKPTLNNGSDSMFHSSRPSSASLRMLQSDSMFNVQFALNVYVKAYPGPVLSIWIYMAALWRRNLTELL